MIYINSVKIIKILKLLKGVIMKKLFENRPDETTPDKKVKLYLSEYGRKRLEKILKRLPPKTDLSQLTGVSISPQAFYNYVKYDKPLSRRGVEACEALDQYFTVEDEAVQGITLETAIKVIKQLGGKVTF